MSKMQRHVLQINQCADREAATLKDVSPSAVGSGIRSCWTGRRRKTVTPDGCLACSQPHPLETLAGTGVDSSTAAAAAGGAADVRKKVRERQ